jgi:hypothetical protein
VTDHSHIVCTIFFWTFGIPQQARDSIHPFTDILACFATSMMPLRTLISNQYARRWRGRIVRVDVVDIIFRNNVDGIPLTATILICGLVCSSRLVASDHTLFDSVGVHCGNGKPVCRVLVYFLREGIR